MTLTNLTPSAPDATAALARGSCPHLARMSQAAVPAPQVDRAPIVRPPAPPTLAGGWWAFRAQAMAAGARA